MGPTSRRTIGLEQVAAWLEGHEEEPLMLCHRGANDAEQPTLFVHLHPCAEEVEISVPAPGVCAVAAKTSTVGPGYHVFVCDLLHALGKQFRLDWDEPDGDSDDAEEEKADDEAIGDETGYFFHREPGILRQEMLRWLSALARVGDGKLPAGRIRHPHGVDAARLRLSGDRRRS